jgi:uncharacterized repeat protein (TIGR03803 family)
MIDIQRTAIRVSATFVMAILAALQPASASTIGTLTVIHSFHGGSDGAHSYSPLVVGAGGVLYGVTSEGGTGSCPPDQGCGTVFSLTPPAAPGDSWTESVIYTFTGGPSDGALPEGVTVGSDGILYGTTGYGGSGPCGSNLYVGCGTVFSLTPPASSGGAWTETILYNFVGGTSDGMLPRAGVTIGADNVLYGTTEYGGIGPCDIIPGCGTVFSLTPPAGGPSASSAWTETILHFFTDSPDGANPLAGVVINNGVLYGTTYNGGAQVGTQAAGTVYSLSAPTSGSTWTETVLYAFPMSGTNGESPLAGVVAGSSSSGGVVLYGTTWLGGITDPEGDTGGVVYSLTPPSSPGGSWAEAVLYAFTNGDDGGSPIGGVVLSPSGALFGTTEIGGVANDGTLFELEPPASAGGAWTETVLHSFQNGKAGIYPEASLGWGPGGELYGTTSTDGAANDGVVFAWKP